MLPKLGLIISEVCQIDESLKRVEETEITTGHGSVMVKMAEKWAVICRSGFGGSYRMPHEYQPLATLEAFRILGLAEVVGFHSAGSLRPSLTPGMLVIPDDWISFAPPVTGLSGQRRHLVPAFSRRIRQHLADAAWKAEVRFENGGIYWQTFGPRLETKAEIKLMSNFADLVGMGLVTEASLAQEMGLEYGAVCSVDNYANGLGAPLLADEAIWEQSAKSAAVFAKVLENYTQPTDTLF
jgi:5'-methylthioadenosine phosphorylase